MLLWLDENLPRHLTAWIARTFSVECHAVVLLGLERQPDAALFRMAGQAGAVIVTKDSDFVEMLEQLGTPPQASCSRSETPPTSPCS
jgi:predicted nuclease of predicted toxin-antitoxin system